MINPLDDWDDAEIAPEYLIELDVDDTGWCFELKLSISLPATVEPFVLVLDNIQISRGQAEFNAKNVHVLGFYRDIRVHWSVMDKFITDLLYLHKNRPGIFYLTPDDLNKCSPEVWDAIRAEIGNQG